MKKILVIFFLAALAIGTEAWYYCRRQVRSTAVAEGALAAFGGLRSIAGEIIWFRADRLQDEGRYVELAQLARALTLSEPHTPEVWAYAAWNLAYNVSAMMPTPEDRWRWVDAAISLLRDDALALNPDSAELYRELAWLYELKLGTDLDSAASIYRERWRERVESAAATGDWASLKMDPARMAAIERDYGVSDRADPFYSAIYWASFRPDHPLLKEIIRQSRALYRKNHPHGTSTL